MKVFGHRGACGYVPENTIESFVSAFALGVDAVELDVIPTKDKQLLVRHDGDLAPTTNISDLPDFSERMRIGYSDGNFISEGWLIEDFDFAELGDLRARERYPSLNKSSAAQNDLYRVPLLTEVISDERFFGKHFIVELKHAKYYRSIGLDPVELVYRDMARITQGQGVKISLESFDLDACARLKAIFPENEVIFALDAPHWNAHKAGGGGWSSLISSLQEAGVDSIAFGFNVAFDIAGYSEFDGKKVRLVDLKRPTGALDAMQEAGFPCYEFRSQGESGLFTEDEYYSIVAGTSFDGVFCDKPDLLIAALRDLSESR